MHEKAITESVLSLVLDHARQAGASSVARVNVTAGEVTGVVAEYVQFYFDFLSKGTIAEGATVAVTSVPIEVRCQDCLRQFQPERRQWDCPDCGRRNLDVVAGRELFVESIEVD